MVVATCPECEGEITFEFRPVLGQKVTCPHCDTDLEVVSVSPLELDWALIDGDDDWSEEEPAGDDEEDDWGNLDDWEEDEADEEEDWEDEEDADL